MGTPMGRRPFLTGTAILSGLLALSGRVSANVIPGQYGFSYEVQKTNSEWLAQLGEYDFNILRKGETEVEGSSPLWNDRRAGHFNCKACDLTLYRSQFRSYPEKKWVFFHFAEPNSVMTGIDGPAGAAQDPDLAATLAKAPELIALFSNEVHCRRCGSHMGHIVPVGEDVLHCINGASLSFVPQAA